VGTRPLHEGFTYLGFRLKPNNYRFGDSTWILTNFQNNIKCWTHRWLSLDGRFTPEQKILEHLSTYWTHLFAFTSHIITKICFILSQFLWSITYMDHKYHLISWDTISRPMELGGWGILNTRIFGWSLLLKSLWWAHFGTNICAEIIKEKYHKRKSLID